MKKLFPIHYLLLSLLVFSIFIALCLHFIPNTMTPLLIGLILAYAFDPIIDYFENKGMKRKKVVFWFFVLIGFIFLFIITILIPYLFIQLSELIENIPSILLKISEWISNKLNIETSILKQKITLFLKEQYSVDNFSKFAKIVRISFTSTASWIGTLATALIIPIFFYFLLLDIDKIKESAFRLVPKQYQSFVKVRLQKVDTILSGFIRGQLTVACVLSILYSIGLSIVGIKYGLLIGITAGILNIVPYLGVGLGIICSIVMAFVEGNLWIQIIGVLLVFGVVQTLEGFFITPNIVGNKVGLNPFTTIIAIVIGGELFGISGMLVAIPLGGICRVIFRDAKAAYLKSNFYKR